VLGHTGPGSYMFAHSWTMTDSCWREETRAQAMLHGQWPFSTLASQGAQGNCS
jgi:hypothetical protein